RTKPAGNIDLWYRGILIFFYHCLAVRPDFFAERLISLKRWMRFPARSEKLKTTKRKSLYERFLQPLRGWSRPRPGTPTVTQHMAQFVAELVRKLAPISRTNVDNNPSHIRWIVVKPNRRRPTCVFLNAEGSRLLVRE